MNHCFTTQPRGHCVKSFKVDKEFPLLKSIHQTFRLCFLFLSA